MPRLRLPLVALAAVAALFAQTAGDASGSHLVTTTADSGAGSFRQALADAQTNAGFDIITFDPAVFPPASPATIHATDDYDVEVSSDLTIDGTGAGVIIDGTGVQITNAMHFRGPEITGLTLRGFTLQNFEGFSTSFGGGGLRIGSGGATTNNLEDVVIDNVVARNNFQANLAVYGVAMSGITISDSEIYGSLYSNGLEIAAVTVSDVVMTHNVIRDNALIGAVLSGAAPEPASVIFTGNTVAENGSVVPTMGVGLWINSGQHVSITLNAFSGNGDVGINLAAPGDNPGHRDTPNDIGDGDSGPNDLLNFPEWTLAGGYEVARGTACANCMIEIYRSDGDPSGHGEGELFLGGVISDGNGLFEFNICGVDAGEFVTATATDTSGNTSEFSENYEALEDAPQCLPLNGDTDCDDNIDARDALLIAVADSGATPLSQEPGCPEIGEGIFLPASEITGPTIFGDVNCSNEADTVDMLAILRHVAGLPPSPPQPALCAQIGEPYPTDV